MSIPLDSTDGEIVQRGTSRSAFYRPPIPPPPGPWVTLAACADPRLDPAVRAAFTTDAVTAVEDVALSVCARCRVVEECRSYADTGRIRVDVWGGRRRGSSPA